MGKINLFIEQLKQIFPGNRLLTDELSRRTYAHDASHYLLIPQVIIILENEAELIDLLNLANQYGKALTFRAAGTSLSGQALTDSILVKLGENWRGYAIYEEGQFISLQPGLIGSEVNLLLAKYGRKIGPDPASLDHAKIGGIAANNASGMCCGVKDNSYYTLKAMRIIFWDGSILDTAEERSRDQFQYSHQDFIASLLQLRHQILATRSLATTIQQKYALKNTVGYAINALIDFEDPIDMIAHLMIGSEGTLGFIANITYHTIVEHAHKKVALFYFADLSAACVAVNLLKELPAHALELMDQFALKAVHNKLTSFLTTDFAKINCALLLEIRAHSQEGLDCLEAKFQQLFVTLPGLINTTAFLIGDAYKTMWNIRKGILPAIAATRAPGTIMLNEDIAVPVNHLGAMLVDLQALLAQHGYTKFSIFGHARDGNMHFLVETKFESKEDITRYDQFMQALSQLISVHYLGSLKAEHGSGRNITAFIQTEWGNELYLIMKKIKRLFDPNGILNPDVIISEDAKLHIQNLKVLPEVHPLVDQCIECGFCEKVCPSKALTFTPRQRIVALRELAKIAPSQANYQTLRTDFKYRGIDSCAATGLCAQTCPVGINTGELIKVYRSKALTRLDKKWQAFMQKHFGLVTQFARIGNRLIKKTPSTQSFNFTVKPNKAAAEKVIFFPSCSARVLGDSHHANKELPEVLIKILNHSGYEVIIPDFSRYCCGLLFNSQGNDAEAKRAQQKLLTVMTAASEQGSIPILTENPSCGLFLKESGIRIYSYIDFIYDYILPHLQLKKLNKEIMLHITCSIKRLGDENKMLQIAQACATKVIVPNDISCCGFAGSKGFSLPALNQSALKSLKGQIPLHCQEGYSCSQTCELGLTKASGIPYKSLLYLIYEAYNV